MKRNARLLAGASFVLAAWASIATAIASAQAMPPAGRQAVWQPAEANFRAVTACEDAGGGPWETCVLRVMEQSGASARAIAFAQWLKTTPNGFGWMTSYRPSRYPPVGTASVFYPMRANTNSAQYVVNGTPAFFDPGRELASIIKGVPIDEIRADHPRAEVWPTATYIAEQVNSMGGPRFVFRSPILDGCHACAVLGQVDLGYDFDRTGHFVTVAFIRLYRKAEPDASERAAAKSSRPFPVLRPDGIGVARVGMTAAQLRSAGIAVRGGGVTGRAPALAGKGCEYASVPSWPLTGLMFSDGRVSRFDVRAHAIRTDRGVRIGDPTTKVLRLYPGARISRDTYLTHGQDIEYTPPPPLQNDRLVFIVDFGNVVAMRSGRIPQVEYVEGCL